MTATKLPDVDHTMTDAAPEVDILARPGANAQVMSKKVLLAALACAEAARLDIAPDAGYVALLRSNFLGSLAISDHAALVQWLTEAGLSHEEFERVMQDFAAVVAVERHYAETLAPRVELHRRLAAARTRRLATLE